MKHRAETAPTYSQIFKRISAGFMLLGITSGIGAIANGNLPNASFVLALAGLLGLILLNTAEQDKKKKGN